MKKHAYLILAHNHFDLLETLVRLLDDERNDIFLHIDKKVEKFDFAHFRSICSRSQVFFTSKRLDSAWGSQRLVLAELELFRTAHKQGPYHCYHLLSGADLPLKSQDEIHKIFEQFPVSRLGCAETASEWDVRRLSRYYHVFPKNRKFGQKLNQLLSSLQDYLKIDRLKRTGIVVKKGSQWGSLTEEAVKCLLSNERKIRKLTRFTICADEIYKQTMLYNSGIAMESGMLRLILWGEDDHPRVLTMKDTSELDKGWIFARKFDPTVDKQVIDYVVHKVGGTADD